MLRQKVQHVTRLRHDLCRDKAKLCRDTKFIVSIERKEDSVATEKFYIVTNTTKGCDELCHDKDIYYHDKS